MDLVLFHISDYIFAFDINKIERILEKKQIITEIPIVPDFISGIMNFQGRIITVVDLANLFNIDSKLDRGFILISREMNNIGYFVNSVLGFKNVNDAFINGLEPCEVLIKDMKINCKILHGVMDLPVSFFSIQELNDFITNPEIWSNSL